jgi:putative peptidoglycan lipid II flippase
MYDGGTAQGAGDAYLPGEDQPGTARGGRNREHHPQPRRRPNHWKPGDKPDFQSRRKRKK